MTTENRMGAPLSAALKKALPDICDILAITFETDVWSLKQMAAGVKKYGDLCQLLLVCDQACRRNYDDLYLRSTPKINDDGVLTHFKVKVYAKKTSIALVLVLSPTSTVLNIRGVYLDSSDECATRGDAEAFKLHLNILGNEKFFKAALSAIPRPKGTRSEKLFIHANCILDEAMSMKKKNRAKLNTRVPAYHQFLGKVLETYDPADGRTTMLRSGVIDHMGHTVMDTVGVRYNADSFEFEVGADYTSLVFAFGAITVGKEGSTFDSAKLCAEIRKVAANADYFSTIMSALIAFEAFSADCPEAEAVRRRMLRVLYPQPVLTTVQAQAC